MPEKKRNPQDATLRNVRASHKQIAALEARVQVLEDTIVKITNWVKAQPRRTSEVPE